MVAETQALPGMRVWVTPPGKSTTVAKVEVEGEKHLELIVEEGDDEYWLYSTVLLQQ